MRELMVTSPGAVYATFSKMATALGATNWIPDCFVNWGDRVVEINNSNSLKTSHPELYRHSGTSFPILLVRKEDGKEFLIGQEGVATILPLQVGKEYKFAEAVWSLKTNTYVEYTDSNGTTEFYIGEIDNNYMYMWSNNPSMAGCSGTIQPETKGFSYSIRLKRTTPPSSARIRILEIKHPLYIKPEDFIKEFKRIKNYELEDVVASYSILKERFQQLENRYYDEFRIFMERWGLLIGLGGQVEVMETRDGLIKISVERWVSHMKEKISKVNSISFKQKIEMLEAEVGIF